MAGTCHDEPLLGFAGMSIDLIAALSGMGGVPCKKT